jgi:hypothetical protein
MVIVVVYLNFSKGQSEVKRFMVKIVEAKMTNNLLQRIYPSLQNISVLIQDLSKFDTLCLISLCTLFIFASENEF